MTNTTIVSSTDCQARILRRLDECYQIANENQIDLDVIPVKFNLTGTSTNAMFKIRNLTDCSFRFNLEVARRNMDEFVKQTVPHEFCHYIVYMDYISKIHKGFIKRPKPHGWEWKVCMRDLFGLSPDRCKNYNTDGIVPKRRSSVEYSYACICQTFTIKGIRHRRIQTGEQTYYCRKCKEPIKFIKKNM